LTSPAPGACESGKFGATDGAPPARIGGPDRIRVANEDQTSTAAGPAKARILIADTSRSVRAALGNHLRERFEVREAEDGEAAWQAVLLDANIRVLLTELGLTKVSGLDLLTRVRSSKVKRIRELPVVVMMTEDNGHDRQRAAGLGVTDFVAKTTPRAELLARLEVLLKLSATREALAETQATLESSRTVDPETELLILPFFDKQVDKLVSYARRNLSDLALICVRVELSVAQGGDTWEGEIEQRAKLVGRTLAASIRLEDLGTRSDRFEFCVATQSSGLSGVLRFAARLRKVLENVEAAGPGVEVWTCIGLATLSEELRRSAEELRALAQKRAHQAQTARSRRIILGTAEGVAPGAMDARGEDGSMDVNLALALIRAGRGGEVVAHLPRLVEQLNPLLRLVRQQQDLQAAKHEGEGSGDKVPRVPR
jgi:two-component system cell cycle response regulator